MSRLALGLLLIFGVFGSALSLSITGATPAFAATTITCTTPATGGTSVTFDAGVANTQAIVCYEVTGVSGTSAYPASITVNSGALPADATFPTTTPGCVQSTSGSGTSEHYILTCTITETPTAGDVGSYSANFLATGSAGVSPLVTGNDNITVTNAASTVCTAPASGGTATTFAVGNPNSFSVVCYGTTGATYPSSITLASGSLPADATEATTTGNGCTQSTSGSGTATHFILTCPITETPTSGDVGTYPVTFTATAGGLGSNATSGTWTLTVSNLLATTCTAPASGGTATTFTVGTASSFSVVCHGTGLPTATYPTSITLNSGSLPADATEATTTGNGCTQSTSGSGATEFYILTCKVTETPTSADKGTYPVTFLATGGGGAPNAVSGTWTLTVAQPAPSWATSGSNDGNYFSAVKGVPFCVDLEVSAGQQGPTGTNPGNTGSLPLTSLTAGTTPANVSNYSIRDVNLTTGTAQLCGTNNNNVASAPVIMAPVATNTGGSATDSFPLWSQNECTWSSSGATVSMFDSNQDLEQSGSQSAFGQPITNGVVGGSTLDKPTCPGGVGVSASGGLGDAWTMNTANPLPTPTDTNPSAALGDLPSSNLDLASATGGAVGGCYGATNILASTSTSAFGTSTASMTLPSSWANGGNCAYGSLGSNSAGGNTDKAGGTNGGQPVTGDANCPPNQADVNAGLTSCGVILSSGNDENGSTNYSSMDIFYNGQPVPQTPTATLSSGTVLAGDTVSVAGGSNWWGARDGAPNSGPYGDFQNDAANFYPVSAPQVLIGMSRATAVPVVNSTVTIGAVTYACTGAESTTVGPNPCTLTVGQPTGTFQVPSGLSPGAYNIYIDESNTTPLPGNGPNDAYQTARGTSLGTAESATQLNVEGVAVVKTSTTSAYGAAGDVLTYNYAVTNEGPDTLSNVTVNDNLIPSAGISCPSTTLAGGATENCTGSYTATQADVDHGSVTNTATVSTTTPGNEVLTSASSSATVYATNATSKLSLVKSTTSSGYGKAGDTISYNYLVTNTGTTTMTGIGVTDNLVASVSCPSPTLAPGAHETCTGSYTVTQADVDAGAVTNLAMASGVNPMSVPVGSNSSSVTVLASNATSTMTLSKSTTSTGYGQAGDSINYTYLVTNTGTTTLSSIGISDNLIASVSCPSGSLAPGSTTTCTATYEVTQADVDAGSVTNVATANATDPYANAITSTSSTVTVNASKATSSLTLVKSTSSPGYGASGDTIGYSYLVTNTGTTTLSGVNVTDSLIPSVSCPDATLAPGASETCTATYTVTQADVDTGFVTNTAKAHATSPPNSGAVTSGQSSVTVDANQAVSDLSIVKSTDSTGYGAAGDTIDYSYLVTNSGTTTLSNVGVTDSLIGNVTCPDSTLAPGASQSCTASYTVTQADVDAGSVTNTAFATAVDDQNAAARSGSSTVVVEASNATSSLTINKSTNSTGYGAAGDGISYTYLVTNTGTTTLSSVGVSDSLVGSVSCPNSTLAPGASETCTGSYTVSQADVDAGSVTNTATANATSPPGGNPVSSGSSAVTVLASKATSTLTLTKSTTSTGYGRAGDTIGYKFLVANTGTTTLSNVGVTDSLVGSVSCPSPTLAPGASETCTASYTVTQADVDAGSVTNTAAANATSPPGGNPVSSASSSVTVQAANATSTLSLTKSTTSTGYGRAGDTIGYKFLVTNTGTTTLSSVGVTDSLVGFVSCPSSTLAPGASETCTASYTASQADVDAGSVTNTATANATAPPGGNPVSSGSSSITVQASNATSTLTLTKSTTSTGYGSAGNVIDYKYLVTNTGTTTLTSVHVTDNRVATVSCPDSTLAPGASETCLGSYTVSQADVDAGSVTNTATAHATNPHAVAVASASSAVTVRASLATSKLSVVEASSASGYHAAGLVIHYTFKVTNIGTTTLSGVHVTDNVATSLSCPSSSLAPMASETCTGSHTVTQADIHAGSITNTVVAHATNPHAVAVTSASSSVTAVAFGLRVTNASLPNGTRNVGYTQTQMTAAGGSAPYTFKLVAGTPPGLKLSATGVLLGKPLTAGTYNVTVEVLDSSHPQVVATAAFTIVIAA